MQCTCTCTCISDLHARSPSALQDDVVPAAHFVGAVMVFGGGCVYMWLQTVIGYGYYRSQPTGYTHVVLVIVRLLLCVLATLLFILGELCSYIHTYMYMYMYMWYV